MTPYAKVILASVYDPDQPPVITMEWNYQRFIHSEVMTHRDFSRGAASSRAIPTARMIEMVREHPAMPSHWGLNQKGMQAELELLDPSGAEALWRKAANDAADNAELLAALGLHKQVVNRVLEPYVWMRTIVTSTRWDNFFELRRHKDAQPEFKVIADLAYEAIGDAPLQVLLPGQLHLPYLSADEMGDKTDYNLCKISAARCARVSYLTHEGRTPNIEEDMELFRRLVVSRPLHASPLEHQATPAPGFGTDVTGNLHAWAQFRKLWERYAYSVDVLDPEHTVSLETQ